MTDTTNQRSSGVAGHSGLRLLEEINLRLKRLGSGNSCSLLPQPAPEAKALLGMRVVQVDDFRSALAAFVPQLMAVLAGSAWMRSS